MNDSPSNMSGLQKEWSLLVHSFLDQSPQNEKIVAKLNSQDLSLEQVKIVKKDLSQQRKSLNQNIEVIKIEIERLLAVIENLKLVGSDASAVEKQIEALHQQGEVAANQMFVTEQKINKIHDLKDRMLKLPDFIDQF